MLFLFKCKLYEILKIYPLRFSTFVVKENESTYTTIVNTVLQRGIAKLISEPSIEKYNTQYLDQHPNSLLAHIAGTLNIKAFTLYTVNKDKEECPNKSLSFLNAIMW